MKENSSPDEWSCSDVYNWMNGNGFEPYATLFANDHKIDGKVLLSLTENDLRERPLQLNVLGDIKRLSKAIQKLNRRCPKLEIVQNGDVKVDCKLHNGIETNGFVVKSADEVYLTEDTYKKN